jgi:hypothetical protein
VRAKNNGTVVIKNSSRVNNGNGSWLKKALDVSDKKALSVKVSSDAGSGYDEVQFFFGSEANESGAAKLFSQVTTAPSLFYLYKEESYSSSYFTDTIENQVIPVMFKSGKDGYYSLELGEYDQFENLILEDRKLNVFQDIKEKNIYRFTSKVTDSKERFLLHFVPVIKPEDKEIIVSVYASQKKLIIDLSRLTTETDVVVSDMMGRVLIKTKLQGETRHYMDLDAKPQLLLVYLKNKMSTVCRKVMWLND